MILPGRLRDTTLGDVLGALFRAQATGTLEIVETDGVAAGRAHRIILREGVIATIASDLGHSKLGDILDIDVSARRRYEPTAHRRIGEYLVLAGLVSPEHLRSALHLQLERRLEALYSLKDGRLLFRPPRPLTADPTDPEPLREPEFLHGRPRKRKRPATSPRSERDLALAVLGLPPGATPKDIHRAFRQLAAEAHPDRKPAASSEERRVLFERFSALSRAYHRLTG